MNLNKSNSNTKTKYKNTKEKKGLYNFEMPNFVLFFCGRNWGEGLQARYPIKSLKYAWNNIRIIYLLDAINFCFFKKINK